MPITNDRPRNASDLDRLTLKHPVGGELRWDLDRSWRDPGPGREAAAAVIAADLERLGLDWPPPGEFAAAALRRQRSVLLAAEGKMERWGRRLEEDRYEHIQANWEARARARRAERGRRRQERARRREGRVEACRRVDKVEAGLPETVAGKSGEVTVRALQPVDAAGRRLGGAFRLEHDEAKGSLRVLGPGGSELSVRPATPFERANDGGLAWAGREVERDLLRGPERGLRTYEVEAAAAGAPLGNSLGSRKVEARTSAEALRAVPARHFAAGLRPGQRAVLLSAIALEDPGDCSYAVRQVPARERGGGRARPERAVSFER